MSKLLKVLITIVIIVGLYFLYPAITGNKIEGGSLILRILGYIFMTVFVSAILIIWRKPTANKDSDNS